MTPRSILWPPSSARMLLYSVSCVVLGCGPPPPRVQANPVSGGVDPETVVVTAWEEPSKGAKGGGSASAAHPPAAGSTPLGAAEAEPKDGPYRNVNVILYRRKQCPLCDHAEKLLRSKGVSLTIEDVDTVLGARDMARHKLARAGHKQVNQLPVVDINGRIVKGFQQRYILELLEWNRDKPF